MKKIAAMLFLGLMVLGGCAKPEQHTTTGVIKSISANGKTLSIDAQAFPGFMDAMTMDYELVDPKISQGLKAGDKIRFTITKQEDFWPVTSVEKIP